MAVALPVKRERKGAQGVRKVKTGCLTCRKRRKKCDETRPRCNQCRSSGWDCDFATPAVAELHTEPATPAGRPRATTPASSPEFVQVQYHHSLARRRPSVLVHLSDADVSHFDFFRTVSARVGGHFFGNNMLHTQVLPAVFNEPCILDAVLALGSVSRRTYPSATEGDPGTSHASVPDPYTVGKYTRALRGLNQRLSASSDNWELAVLMSIIFTGIEALQDNHLAAQTHIRSSLAILNSLGSPPDRTPTTQVEMRETLTALSKALREPSLAIRDRTFAALGTWPSLPSVAFASIDEARKSLNTINGSLNTLHGGPRLPRGPGMIYCTARLLDVLGSWNNLFSQSTVDTRAIDSDARTEAGILLIHHRVAHISASAFLQGRETAYDSHASDFDFIIQLCNDILQARKATDKSSQKGVGGGSGTFGSILLQPLFFVAYKCRDGILRRRAVQAMETARVSTYSKHARISTQVARFIISQEEGDASTDPENGPPAMTPGMIKEKDRLHDVELKFEAETSGYRVKAWRIGDNGEKEVVETLITFS